MPILNRDRFPEVEFLDGDEIRIIGTVGNVPLALVGFEEGTDAPIVARALRRDRLAEEELDPIPLYELLSHSYDPINIPEPITR